MSAKIRSVRIRTRGAPVQDGIITEDAASRHHLLIGFDQSKVLDRKTAVVGNGLLGSLFAMAKIRQGNGLTMLVDPDIVEKSNLVRQLYFPEDIGSPKPLCLARNLEQHAPFEQSIWGCWMRGEEYLDALRRGEMPRPDELFVGIDAKLSTLEIANFVRNISDPPIHTVFAKISSDADAGFVFVQDTDQGAPCINCRFRYDEDHEDNPCPVGSSIEIGLVVAGFAVYASHSLYMDRPRHWNYRDFSLGGDFAKPPVWIPQREDCPVCTGTWRSG